MIKNLVATALQISLLVSVFAVSAQEQSSLFSDWEYWQWQQIEIVLKDNFLTASLNGEIVLRATDIENASGYIGFQSEKGVIEYRNLVIHER